MTNNNLTTEEQKLADELGQLLAESVLNPEIKDALADNVERMPKDMIFRLLNALRSEKKSLERLETQLELFDEEQDEKWKKLADDQQKFANDLVTKVFNQLTNDSDMEDARKAIKA